MKKIIGLVLVFCCMLFTPLSASANNFKLLMTDPKPDIDGITLTNDDISIKFLLTVKNSVNVELQNRTNKTIKIDWNQIAIVDPSQKTHKIIHGGILYKSRNDIQAPTVIPPIPMAKVSDTLFPLDLIEFKNDFWSGARWVSHDFFTDGDNEKTISIFMPLDIGGTTKDYIFTLKLVKEKS